MPKKTGFFSHNEPLGMQKGSVRSILAAIIILGTVSYVLLYQDINEYLATMSGVVTTFYFMQRMSETK